MAADRGDPSTPASEGFGLHPCGRRGGLVFALLFAVALAMRLPGINDPPSMVSDEYLYVPAAGGYLRGVDNSFERTHPPLFKELTAVAIAVGGGIEVTGQRRLPTSVTADVSAVGPGKLVWSDSDGVRQARVASGCRLGEPDELRFPEGVAALATDGDRVAGGGDGWMAFANEGRVTIDGLAAEIAILDDSTYVLSDTGRVTLVRGSRARKIASGASDLGTVPEDGRIWISFPSKRVVAAFDVDGKRLETIATRGRPAKIAIAVDPQSGRVPHAVRLFVTDPAGSAEVIDPFVHRRTDGLDDLRAELMTGALPTMVWTANRTQIRAVESKSLAIVGHRDLATAPRSLEHIGEGEVIAVSTDELLCLRSRVLTAARSLSALFGAVVVALTGALAIRITGSVFAGVFAGLLMLLEGMHLTLSRLGWPEPSIVAFALIAWFATFSACFHASRRAAGHVGITRFWMLVAAAACGAGIATKWSGAWALFGVVGLLAWDYRRNGDRAVLRDLSGQRAGVALSAAIGVAIIAAVYLAAFLPHIAQGDSLADIASRQAAMYQHHAGEAYTYWESHWYQWFIGGRAIRLFATQPGPQRAEIWLMPNAALVILGVAALVTLARRHVPTTYRLILYAAAVQVVPWILAPRATLVYHSAALIPFATIALVACLKNVSHRSVRFFAGILVVTLVVTVFVWTLPLTVGGTISRERHDRIVDTMRWQIRPPDLPWDLLR